MTITRLPRTLALALSALALLALAIPASACPFFCWHVDDVTVCCQRGNPCETSCDGFSTAIRELWPISSQPSAQDRISTASFGPLGEALAVPVSTAPVAPVHETASHPSPAW